MKCPMCSTWSEVLETRGDQRRRRCANDHRFSTVEVVSSHSARKVTDRNRQAAKQVLAGQTQTEVARHFNMPRSELSRYMKAKHPDHNSRTNGQKARWLNTKEKK